MEANSDSTVRGAGLRPAAAFQAAWYWCQQLQRRLGEPPQDEVLPHLDWMSHWVFFQNWPANSTRAPTTAGG